MIDFKVGKKYWVMYMGQVVEKELLYIKKRSDTGSIVNLNFPNLATDSTKAFETKQELFEKLFHVIII